MEVQIDYLGASQFEIHARNHVLVSDQPAENGGFDEGMTPPELLLASLGACAGYYAVAYLKAHQLPTEGVRVSVGAQKAAAPARLAAFKIEIDVPETLDARHREGVLRAGKKCLIHNTLVEGAEISTSVAPRSASRAA
jgi:putative redox protein